MKYTPIKVKAFDSCVKSKAKSHRSGYKEFEKYALRHGVHNGPTTLKELKRVYNQHKGSQYKTIVALFKARGEIEFLKQYDREMGL